MILSFISKLVRTISITRVSIWTLAAILGVGSLTVYEHREQIFNSSHFSMAAKNSGNMTTQVFSISEETKGIIKKYVDDEQEIIGLAVLSADERLNLRNVMYFYNDGSDPLFTPNVSPFPTQLPLFTTNEENNREIVKLINGEFVCSPFSSSILAKTSPNVSGHISATCRASLPPYYGHFIGFVTIFLKDDPDLERQSQLKSRLEHLATQIYFKDVLPTLHTGNL